MGLKKFPYCIPMWLGIAITMLILNVKPTFGDITKDTTIFSGSVSGIWKAGYNYNVISDIEVLSGDQLIIEAGAVVNFNENVRFNIKGQLIASGEDDSPIVFKKVDQKEKWYGIHVLDNAPAPHLEYCVISDTKKDPSTGTIGALSVNSNQVPIIRYCEFSDNEGGTIYLHSF